MNENFYVRKEFTIVVEVDTTTEAFFAKQGGINARHIAAGLNCSNTEGELSDYPLGQIIWAPEYQEDQAPLVDVGWYIVGVKGPDDE